MQAELSGARDLAAPSGSRRLLPLAAILVPMMMLAGGSWLSWRDSWAKARLEMAQTAGAAAQYGARTLEGYALGVGRVNDHLRGLTDAAIRADEPRLSAELQRVVADLPQAALAFVVDRQGIPLIATHIMPVPRNSVADRDYFVPLGARGGPDIVVTPTFEGRIDSRVYFSVSRRRIDGGNPPAPDGFDGVVLLSAEPAVAAEGLRLIRHAGADRAALVDAAGRPVVDTAGALPAEAPPLLDLATAWQALGGARVFETRLADGTEVLAATRQVAGFGLLAVAMRPRRDIVAAWREGLASHLIFGVPATLTLFWLSLALRRDQRQQDRRAAGLAHDVEQGADRLNRARRFGLVGTFEHDLRSGVSRRSAEYMAVHGLDPRTAEETHADWLRRLHPDDRERAERHLLDTLAEGHADTYGQTYRIITADGEVRWIAAQGEIDRDAGGHAIAIRGAHVDVTPLRTTELALAESDARLRLAQEAVGIGTFEWHPAQRFLNWSRTMIELWGFDPALGQPSMAAAQGRLHPEDAVLLRRQMASAAREGRVRFEFRLRRPLADGGVETVWLAARGRRLEGGDGRIMGVAYDITERKRADEHNQMLAHEVEHRAKNVLAVVSGLLRVTEAASLEEYVETMQGRIGALARTLSLLGEQRWRGAELRALLSHELAPFHDSTGHDSTGQASKGHDSTGQASTGHDSMGHDTAGDDTAGDGTAGRVTLDGPAVTLPPDLAQPLSMALHELATNAAKYGALATPTGRLSVRWRLLGDEAELVWEESGGPAVEAAPTREGFGSALIQQSFGGGAAVLEWRREGLRCTLRLAVLVD